MQSEVHPIQLDNPRGPGDNVLSSGEKTPEITSAPFQYPDHFPYMRNITMEDVQWRGTLRAGALEIMPYKHKRWHWGLFSPTKTGHMVNSGSSSKTLKQCHKAKGHPHFV